MELLLVFLAGAAGSLHCLGMCGGFACAIGAGAHGRTAWLRRQLLYNLGRATSYCFLGALAGRLGAMIVGQAGEATAADLAQRGLALASGLLMLLVGLQFLGWLGRMRLAGAARLAAALRSLMHAPGPGAPLARGVANGLLPCPLVYAFVAQAAAAGGALPGFATMAAFGLGTFPMMLIAGGAGGWLRRRHADAAVQPVRWQGGRGGVPGGVPGGAHRRVSANFPGIAPDGTPGPGPGTGPGVAVRRAGVRTAGAFIVVLGLITCARGLLPLGVHFHGL